MSLCRLIHAKRLRVQRLVGCKATGTYTDPRACMHILLAAPALKDLPSPIAPTRDTRRDASTRHLSLPRISVPLVIIRGSQTLSNNAPCRSPPGHDDAKPGLRAAPSCLANDGGPIREEEEEGRIDSFSLLFLLFSFSMQRCVSVVRETSRPRGFIVEDLTSCLVFERGTLLP